MSSGYFSRESDMQGSLAISIVQTILTAILAGIAATIAWRQAETARAKLRLDLFERRFRVYRGLMDLLAAAIHEPRLPHDALGTFSAITREKQFLFDSDVTGYLDEVRDKAVKLNLLQQRIDGLRDDSKHETERTNAIESHVELLSWFDDQAKQAQSRFLKYLDFKKNL